MFAEPCRQQQQCRLLGPRDALLSANRIFDREDPVARIRVVRTSLKAPNTPCYRWFVHMGDFMNELETVKLLADDVLIQRVHHDVREDRRVSALLLAHLGEMDARELHRDLGYESMFDYAVRALHMSDSEAGLRLYASRFARRFPAALGMLSRGELHLTAMKLLSPVLTEHNAEMLDMACLKTKQEIQVLIAKHCPQPDAPDVIRRMPARIPARTESPLGLTHDRVAQSALTNVEPATADSAQGDAPRCHEAPRESGECDAERNRRHPRAPDQSHAPHMTSSCVERVSALPPSATSANQESAGADRVGPNVDRADGSWSRIPTDFRSGQASNRHPVLPISEGRFKIQFTASQRVRDLLQEAQDLYRNQLPSGDIEVIVERALSLLVAARKKELFAQTDRPRRTPSAKTIVVAPCAVQSPVASSFAVSAASVDATSPGQNPRSRHVANEVRRRVSARDREQCFFVGPTGKRCTARGRLEFHHVQAFGLGGATTESNIVLCCRAHNRLFAERDFTREHILRCIRESQAARARGGSGGRAGGVCRADRSFTEETSARSAKQQEAISEHANNSTRSGPSDHLQLPLTASQVIG